MAELKCKECGSTNVKGSKSWYICQNCGSTVKHGLLIEDEPKEKGDKK